MSTGTVQVICRPASAAGFALAGLSQEVVPPYSEPQTVVDAALGHEGVGVVLLEETIHDALPDDLRRAVERSVRPVVVPFPSAVRTAPESAEDRIVELLRRAIGYRVRLR